MVERLRKLWNQLTPQARTWLLGALHAGWVSVTASGVSFVGTHNWKTTLWVLASTFIGGVKLYRMQNPLPREVWTDEQRAALTNGDTVEGKADGATA